MIVENPWAAALAAAKRNLCLNILVHLFFSPREHKGMPELSDNQPIFSLFPLLVVLTMPIIEHKGHTLHRLVHKIESPVASSCTRNNPYLLHQVIQYHWQ